LFFTCIENSFAFAQNLPSVSLQCVLRKSCKTSEQRQGYFTAFVLHGISRSGI